MKNAAYLLLALGLLTGCSGGGDEETPPVEVVDSDSDGIADDVDQCPDSRQEDKDIIDDTGCVGGEFDSFVIGINAGGTAYIADNGLTYVTDAYYVGGELSSTDEAIADTDNDVLYQSERWGEFSYEIPVNNGVYTVSIHLAEIYHSASGKRTMDIAIEGASVADAIDIYELVGANQAHVLQVPDVTVTDGMLNIEFNKIVDNAKVAAIDVASVLNRADDEDNDGVLNYLDACVMTDASMASDVLENGCALGETDADHDGLLDNIDQCLDTNPTSLIDDLGCSASQVDTDGDGVMDAEDWCDATANSDIASVDSNGCSATEFGEGVFVEENGILAIEMEDTEYSNNWHVREGDFASGDRYLEWMGYNYFNEPGNGTITIKVKINNPGIYRFDWRNLIAHGNDPTEHNDSWLRIQAHNFYGDRNGHIVCPRGQLSSNQCVGAGPAGSSSGGWFKIYRSGGPTDAWKWSGYTSDNDAHAVFAEFQYAGEYEIDISGRSRNHAIDRLVLYRQNNSDNNVAYGYATSLEPPLSGRQ